MDKDNKVLLAAVLIILVALVAFNFGDITGKAVKDDGTVIAVSPTTVKFGEYDTMKLVTIKVIPGKDGVDTVMSLYMVDGFKVSGETVNICTDSICREEATLTYKLDSELKPGKYYFKAERVQKGKTYKSNSFEIAA